MAFELALQVRRGLKTATATAPIPAGQASMQYYFPRSQGTCPEASRGVAMLVRNG